MRVAIVHDWLTGIRGGERVLEALLELLPEADLFSLMAFPDRLSPALAARPVHVSFVQNLPFVRARYRYYLPLFPRAVESFDLSPYDLVVSSSHGVAKGAVKRPGALHISYVHTPMRYVWGMLDQYFADGGLGAFRRAAASTVLGPLRVWDRRTASRVDHFLANSENVARRIRSCYGREATVIYPPVTLGPFDARPRKRDRYVTVSRLVPYKRVDVLAAAFAHLPGRELVIVGEGPERNRIEAAAGSNVTLVGHASDERRDEILHEARAFLFAAEEDFGIAPLEAQAAGVPVIAYGLGGVRETIRGLDDREPTGVFFDAQTPEAVADAVLRFEANEARFDAATCRRNAERFSVERFRREFAAHVEARYAEFRARRPA